MAGLFGKQADLSSLMQDYAPKVQGVMPGDQPMPNPNPSPMPKRGGGLFGSDGWGTAILGAVGDYLLQANGMQPMYAPRISIRDQQSYMQRRADQQRQQERDDWVWRQQYEAEHPKPSTAQPYRWEDNAGNVWEYGQDGQPKRIFTDVVPKYYIQGDRALQIPNPYNGPSAAPASPTVLGAQLPQGWTPDNGGPTATPSGGFRARP